MNTSPFLF